LTNTEQVLAQAIGELIGNDINVTIVHLEHNQTTLIDQVTYTCSTHVHWLQHGTLAYVG